MLAAVLLSLKTTSKLSSKSGSTAPATSPGKLLSTTTNSVISNYLLIFVKFENLISTIVDGTESHDHELQMFKQLALIVESLKTFIAKFVVDKIKVSWSLLRLLLSCLRVEYFSQEYWDLNELYRAVHENFNTAQWNWARQSTSIVQCNLEPQISAHTN